MTNKEFKGIPIITLWQPWCYWILLGWKTIETRLHDRFKGLVRKNIIIHAGKKWDNTAIDQAKKWLSPYQIKVTNEYKKVKSGFLVCYAHVFAFRRCTKYDSESALIDCENTERYGLVLSNIRLILNNDFEVKGHQGIWYL